MKLNLNGVTYYYHWLNGYEDTRPTLLCLHGFTGTHATFLSFAQSMTTYNVLAVDLIGHGQTSSLVHPQRYEMTHLIADLGKLTQHLKLTRFALLGYSMGGRVALGFSLTFPELITKLILISSSPGLKEPTEQLKRQRQDRRLAQKLLTQPLLAFVDEWEKLPLFTTQVSLSKIEQTRIRSERLSQNKLGLALSLLKMGTGQQESYWESLEKLGDFPTLMVTGGLDLKFCEIAKKMKKIQPSIEHLEMPKTGHAVYLEQMDKFNQQIEQWLNRGSRL